MNAKTLRYRGLLVATSEPGLPSHCMATVRVLAAELPAAIRLLFVEDDELLRAAELPFTAEFCPLTNRRKPLTRDVLERTLGLEARRAAREAAAIGGQLGRDIAFETRRQALATVLRTSESSISMIVPRGSASSIAGAKGVLTLYAGNAAENAAVRAISERLAGDAGKDHESTPMPGGVPSQVADQSAIDARLEQAISAARTGSHSCIVAAATLADTRPAQFAALISATRVPLVLVREPEA